MSRNNETLLEEARLLLPWYLTGQLSAVEKELVENALGQFSELQAELKREEQMKKLVCQDAQLLELSALDTTPQRLENLLRRITREEEQKQESTTLNANAHLARPVVAQPKTTSVTAPKSNKWQEWLKNLFSIEWLTPANAVLAGLLVCQVGVGAFYIAYQHNDNPKSETVAQANIPPVDPTTASESGKTDEDTSKYSLAGTEDQNDNQSVVALADLKEHERLLLVEFNPDAKISAIQKFLDEQHMVLVRSEKSDRPNTYTLKYKTHLDGDKLPAYLDELTEKYKDVISHLGKNGNSL